MRTRRLLLTAAVVACTVSPCFAESARTGDDPHPVGSPGRATSNPGTVEHPNAGHAGATESGNVRRPAGPGGSAQNSGPGSGAGAP